MNLLTDAWIPIQKEGRRRMIRLQDVLCRDEAWQLSLPRDDMEMACLQLIICLTQVIFTPEDARALKQRIRHPLSEDEYEDVTPYLDWFELNHPETPFMQVRGVKATNPTPVQKLFVGLPEGNNHAFFNDPGEILKVCSPCAVIALFNQNSNAPGFSGKQKAGIRGPNPITTLVSSSSLRNMVWFNVLHRNTLSNKVITTDDDDPVWVRPIIPATEIEQYIKETKPKTNEHKRKRIMCSDIGLTRGLFWLPILIELISDTNSLTCDQTCDFCGEASNEVWRNFNLGSDFYFNILGNWPHPHSPRYWKTTKGAKEEKYASFTTTAPAWTQLSRFVIEQNSEKEGQQPAAVVSQFRRMMNSTPLVLTVGGYRNKQASILQRRHELLTLAEGWENSLDDLKGIVESALKIKSALRNKLYGFAKASGASSVPNEAESLFYHNSETMIHNQLYEVSWQKAAMAKNKLIQDLISLSWEIFGQVIRPYQHEPKMILAIAIARKTLGREFRKIQGGQP